MANYSLQPRADKLNIVNLGEVTVAQSYTNKLPQALKDGVSDWPKELAYTGAGMGFWESIAKDSHQTTEEMHIIDNTVEKIVNSMPLGTVIYDLGAGDSDKFQRYLQAFITKAQGSSIKCTYAPLDLNEGSLVTQIKKAKSLYPEAECLGLYGSFEEGDAYFAAKPAGQNGDNTARLFLSMGSIFFNGPEHIVSDRLVNLVNILGPHDCLVAGQDGYPDEENKAAAQSHYQTAAYNKFIANYLQTVNQEMGIAGHADETWTFESKFGSDKHFFEVTALKDLTTTKLEDNFTVPANKKFAIFKSWKFTPDSIAETVSKVDGLTVECLGKGPNSDFHQYLIKKA